MGHIDDLRKRLYEQVQMSIGKDESGIVICLPSMITITPAQARMAAQVLNKLADEAQDL